MKGRPGLISQEDRMSEAKTADKVRREPVELAIALLELFELLVANATEKGDNIETLGEWADEFKPRLERLIHGTKHGASSAERP